MYFISYLLFFKQEVDFIVEIGKVILKFIWDHKGPGLAKTILKKKKLSQTNLTPNNISKE